MSVASCRSRASATNHSLMTHLLQPTNPTLSDELDAINSIYGLETCLLSDPDPDSENIKIVLSFPNQPFSFILHFASDYPATPPHIGGTQTTSTSSKGAGTAASSVLRDVLARVWITGSVCLFDLIEEAGPLLRSGSPDGQGSRSTKSSENDTARSDFANTASTGVGAAERVDSVDDSAAVESTSTPQWILSDPYTEKKSTFLARCCTVSSASQASSYMLHLLATDKKAAGATHNITAWRIRHVDSPAIQVQDCDDDGETAAGGRLLHLLQLMGVWNVMVVVTRWYGGVKMGPDRFRVINRVAREAVVRFREQLQDEQGKGNEREKVTRPSGKGKRG